MQIVIDIPKEKYKTICEMYGTFPKEMKDWGLEAIKNGTPLNEIRAEIAKYKDDKIIHLERNEMIDMVLEIIDKYKTEGENEDDNT